MGCRWVVVGYLRVNGHSEIWTCFAVMLHDLVEYFVQNNISWSPIRSFSSSLDKFSFEVTV